MKPNSTSSHQCDKTCARPCNARANKPGGRHARAPRRLVISINVRHRVRILNAPNMAPQALRDARPQANPAHASGHRSHAALPLNNEIDGGRRSRLQSRLALKAARSRARGGNFRHRRSRQCGPRTQSARASVPTSWTVQPEPSMRAVRGRHDASDVQGTLVGQTVPADRGRSYDYASAAFRHQWVSSRAWRPLPFAAICRQLPQHYRHTCPATSPSAPKGTNSAVLPSTITGILRVSAVAAVRPICCRGVRAAGVER